MWSNNEFGLPAACLALVRKSVLFLAALTALAILACHLDGAGGKSYMDIRGDASWTQFDTLQIVLEDGAGARIATLYDRRLLSLSELSGLSAEQYGGGAVRVVIIGKKNGAVVFKEERIFDGRVTTSRDTLVFPPGAGGAKVLDLRPDNATLFLGGGKDSLQAYPLAEWAGAPLSWSTSDSGVVTVTGRGVLEAKGVGSAYVRAARGDAFDQSLITVVRDVPVLDPGAADTAILLNSTLAFHVKATQAYGTIAAFAWDLDGDGKWDDSMTAIAKGQTVLSTPPRNYPKAGSHDLRFYVRDGEGNAAPAPKRLTVTDKVPVVESLKDVLRTHPGVTEVQLKLLARNATTVLRLDDKRRVTPSGALFASGGHFRRRLGQVRLGLHRRREMG